MFMVLNEDLGSYETTQKTMRKKILLVDDSPFFLKALSDALSVDFHVETASSGEKAINLLKEIDSAKPGDIGPFDLVITDLEMTGLSGYDVSQFIRNKKGAISLYQSSCSPERTLRKRKPEGMVEQHIFRRPTWGRLFL